ESVEAIQERAELGRAQPLADPGGAADVREQEAHRDLRAKNADLVQVLDAGAADRWIAGEPRETDVPQHGAAGALERRRAQLAVGPVRHAPPESAYQGEARILAREESTHRLFGCGRAWHRNPDPTSTS